MKNIWICVIYLILSSCGSILIKLGSMSKKSIITIPVLHTSYSWSSLAGILCYGCSFVLVTVILSNMNLSFAPAFMGAAVMCITTAAGLVLFQETLTCVQWIGFFMIIAGAFLLGLKR